MKEIIRKLFLEKQDKFNQLEQQINLSPEKADRSVFLQYGQMKGQVDLFNEFQKLELSLLNNKEMINDESNKELFNLIKEDNIDIESKMSILDNKLLKSLIDEETSNKNVIIEIRASVGGEESTLFVADVLRMYELYCKVNGWRMETLNLNTECKGIKEATVLVKGNNVYSQLKFEGGVHRVQRVPETENKGRMQTSTVTVAIMEEADEVDVKLDLNDIEMDTMKGTGPGGQSVNTTDSAVRLHHKPTGLIVYMCDEKSQTQNKEKALMVLRSRLYELERQKEAEKALKEKNEQIGNGERSEKIRTYNYQQDRVTDHRINQDFPLCDIINGKLNKMIEVLKEQEFEEKLKNL